MARPKIDEELVRQLVKLLDESGLTELDYAIGKLRIRVSRAAGKAAPTVAVDTSEQDAAGSSDAEAASSHPGAVTSPMVGTVYLAPEPGMPPYVKVGDKVGEGQTLFLIEAMKTMNPIAAPRPGRVSQIFAQNAAPVEYGEVLIILE